MTGRRVALIAAGWAVVSAAVGITVGRWLNRQGDNR